MIVPEEKTILKDKTFIGVFVFGMVCAVASLIVRGIYTS
jgi:hypothetical protein